MRKTEAFWLLAGTAALAGCTQGSGPAATQAQATGSPGSIPVAATARPISDGYVHSASASGVVCDNRPLSLDGSHSRVEVSGPCRTLRVTGEHNDVIVGMAPGGTILVTGAHNDIWWHMDGRGRLPDLRDGGASNTFHREDG